MKPLFNFRGYSARVSFAALSGAFLFATLTGCGGMGTIPDTSIPGEAVHPGAIQGSVFGGHAPIVGAHVYVLEVGQSGYASAAVSKLTTGSGTDTHGTYVTTDTAGAFNITGDYTCDAGEPVYLASVGGSSSANSTLNITSASFTETGNSGKYVVTFSATNTLAAGTNVTFAGLTGGYAQLNGTTQVVTTPLSGTQFSIAFTGGHGSLSGTTTGSATFGVNGAIINMATLGLCPGTSGEFANTLSYVYMNEVSTTTTAFALAGFGSGPFNIGAPSTNLIGIKNAAVNAGQLYDIQGSSLSTTSDGEGHIARPSTPAGNGTVPQATIDTLADILASCVDSSGITSSQCTTLFTYATSTGATSGTQPTDTATAIFNIAQFPAGTGTSSATFMAKLFALQSSGVVPYTPNLLTAPNDFTLAISYPNTLNTNMGNPESIAIDSVGNVVFSNQSTDYITRFLPTGALSFKYDSGGIPGYVSIDPSNNIWFGSVGSSNIVEIAASGNSFTQSIAGFSTVSATATDSSGNFYFVASANNVADVYEYTNTFGSPAYSPFTGSTTCIPSKNTYDHLAIDSTQNLWVTDEHNGEVCRFSTTGAVANANFPLATGTYPEAIGIDASGSAWFTMQSVSEVGHVTLNGSGKPTLKTLTSSGTGATFAAPFSAAIDGASNIWITNRTSNTIAELNNAGTAISPVNNYQYGTGILNDPLNAAVDGSGNVWITNYGGQKVVELIGAATPAVTPLSLASGNGGLGNTP